MPRCTRVCPAENRSRIASFKDQVVTGNTGTVQSVGTTPCKAMQRVFVPPKLGAGGDHLSVLLLQPMGKDWQLRRATLVP